jgi:hypothetical protein
MGRLLPTGAPNLGHAMDFEYQGLEPSLTCELQCQCGWKTEIKSFRKPWSILEVKMKVKNHMSDLGLSFNDK